MDDQRTELEFDEFEKLLGEIPNATSGNSHLEEVGPKSASLNDSSLPACVNSFKALSTEKPQSNGGLDDIGFSFSSTQASPIKRLQSEEENLPDDQALTSAFAELCINSGTPLANCKSSPHHVVLSDFHHTNNMKNSLPSTISPVIVVPPFQSATNVPCSFDEFTMAKVGQESSNFLKPDAQELKQMSVDFYQPQKIDEFSTALPLARGVQGFQFCPDMAVAGVELPLMSDQQHYFADLQSARPYLHSQQLNQPHIMWMNMKEEQYYRLHQQYVYLQQLHNQGLESQNQIQANETAGLKLMKENVRQPSFELLIPHQPQKPIQESFWNNYAATSCLNKSQHPLHAVDKVGKHSLPEKIVTRSQGMNMLKAVKLGSVVGNVSFAHQNQNGKVLSSGHLCHNLSTPNAGCRHLDRSSSCNLSPKTTHCQSTTTCSQPRKYNSVDEVTTKIYHMAKDQHGCRFLQRKFSEGTPQDVEKIFLEIIDHIVELMTDPFGNYLVQKLLEVCDEDQRMQLLGAITRKPGELVRISCDIHGTRAVQKVIQTLKSPEQFAIVVSSLKPGIVTLIKNMNGNHVAQRCLQYLMPEYSEFLFEATTANCVELATDRHGCCVLQKCLSHFEGEQRNRLVCEITTNALILSRDPFGNYVVQYIFELQLPWATATILDQLEGNYLDLSMQKYSSNVVEKCLKYAGEEHFTCIMGELISSKRLDQVMQDPYGNYVIQAALHLSKGALHAALVDTIKPLVPALRTSPYGKKVLCSKILRK